jgi:hypothetical protein
MEEPIYNNLPDIINFNYNSTIHRIHDIKYNGNNIFFLFSNNDVIFLLGYDNIDKKQLFLKSKTVDIDSLLTPISIKISNNYVIIISENENQSKTSKKILAKITIWEYIQDKSYCFQTDFYHMSRWDIFNNYIVLSTLLGPTKANIIHIYNIIPFNGENTEECNNINTGEISNLTELEVNKKNINSANNVTSWLGKNLSNSNSNIIKNSIFDNLIVLSCNNKKTIKLNKDPIKLGKNKSFLLHFYYINIDKGSVSLNTFPDINISINNNWFIYKYVTERKGYNFNKKIFLENDPRFISLFIINSLIYNNKIFLLGRDKINDNILFHIIDINNLSSINTITLVTGYSPRVADDIDYIKIINDEIFITFNSLIFIIKNNSLSDLLQPINMRGSFLIDINKENKNILVLSTTGIKLRYTILSAGLLNFTLNEYKYSNYPYINSVVDNNSISDVNKKKYINKVLSDFSIFKKYILENNLIEEGLSENDFSKFNYQDIFKNLKKFGNNILKYIKSLPNNNNKNYNNLDLINYKVQEIYKKLIYQFIPYINNFFSNISRQINYGYEMEALITRGNEIQSILTFISINGIKKTRIIYPGEQQINAGGVRRSFFTKLEELLNTKFYLNFKIKEIDSERKKINSQINRQLKLQEMKKSNQKKSREEIEKLFKNNYNKINKNRANIVSERNLYIATHSSFGLNDHKIFDILVLSKVNNTPIYYDDNKLKNIILKEIFKIYRNTDIKKILYNLFTINKNDIIDNRYLEEIKLIDNNGNNMVNNSNEVNNNQNNKFMLNSRKSLKLIDHINGYIAGKYYVNMLDVYITHFINLNINIESLKKKIKFNTYRHNNDERFINFQTKFIKCLESLDQENLKLFNMAITGSRLEQVEDYSITLQILNKSGLSNTQIVASTEPEFHTCFNRMDIKNMIDFEDKYMKFNQSGNFNSNSKKDFINLWKVYSKNTMYTMA